jgi:hypothetical protein
MVLRGMKVSKRPKRSVEGLEVKVGLVPTSTPRIPVKQKDKPVRVVVVNS